MKKFFICLKKSVRTFKLRIEPYFLSHALRGEPFQIQDFLGEIQNRRHFVPTIFLVPNPISFFGGEGGIRTLDTVLRLYNTLAVCRFRPTQPPLQKAVWPFRWSNCSKIKKYVNLI